MANQPTPDASASTASDLSNVHVIDHPLIAHMLTVVRDEKTPSDRFREMLGHIGELLAYEALRSIRTIEHPVTTPMEPHMGTRIDPPVALVPIMRAGLGLAEGMLRLIPGAQMGHLGMFRDEQALEPVSYYEKLPPRIAEQPVLLVDPMLATGGSASQAVTVLRKRGCTDITFICLIAAPEGITRLRHDHPDLPIYTAHIDRQLDNRGYILPGLGDAGDRIYGTL